MGYDTIVEFGKPKTGLPLLEMMRAALEATWNETPAEDRANAVLGLEPHAENGKTGFILQRGTWTDGERPEGPCFMPAGRGCLTAIGLGGFETFEDLWAAWVLWWADYSLYMMSQAVLRPAKARIVLPEGV